LVDDEVHASKYGQPVQLVTEEDLRRGKWAVLDISEIEDLGPEAHVTFKYVTEGPDVVGRLRLKRVCSGWIVTTATLAEQ
jgi:hypothetical protein